jgi:hypothetical protein
VYLESHLGAGLCNGVLDDCLVREGRVGDLDVDLHDAVVDALLGFLGQLAGVGHGVFDMLVGGELEVGALFVGHDPFVYLLGEPEGEGVDGVVVRDVDRLYRELGVAEDGEDEAADEGLAGLVVHGIGVGRADHGEVEGELIGLDEEVRGDAGPAFGAAVHARRRLSCRRCPSQRCRDAGLVDRRRGLRFAQFDGSGRGHRVFAAGGVLRGEEGGVPGGGGAGARGGAPQSTGELGSWKSYFALYQGSQRGREQDVYSVWKA